MSTSLKRRKLQHPRSEVDFEYLSAPQVCQRYGGRSHMWLVRLLRNDPNFRRPIKFQGRGMRFFRVADLVKYERERVAA